MSSCNAVPFRYRPKITRGKCSWVLPTDFTENKGLAVLGTLQDILSQYEVKSCVVDLRNVQWADPQPLLILGLVLAESNLAKEDIILDFGSYGGDDCASNHRIFLKFFAEQGFLSAFNPHVEFRCRGKIESDFQSLFLQLTAVPQPTHFLNADCIRGRIMRTDCFRENRSSLQVEVEKILDESKDLSSKTAFGSDPVARDVLFQKLRKILYEILLNVAEHSHMEKDRSYAGIYARIRGAKPPVERDASSWSELFNKTNSIFGQRDFSPNHYAEWLELYICDIGRGMIFHINDWILPKGHPDFKGLEQAKKAKNPFLSIVHRFFRTGFSRFPRHNAERTAVTGLQHLGHLLAVGGDYCRIYTQKGSWAGGHHPWAESHIPSPRDIRDTTQPINKEFKGLNPVSGTAYAFNIQPDHRNFYEGQSIWENPGQIGTKKILESLKNHTFLKPKVVTDWYDRCNDHCCLPPEIDETYSLSPKVLVLRPPRLVNKQDLGKWLELVAGNSLTAPRIPVETFVIADLSPFQVLTFHELLLNLHARDDSRLDLYLVAENWAVSCVRTEPGIQRFIADKKKAYNFLNKAESLLFSVLDLAVLLRQMDSEIFWNFDTGKVPSPFFEMPVDWFTSKNAEQGIRLTNYIDFPLALVEPERYRACLRSLRRCLALFPGYNSIGADDLVSSLVRDVNLSSYAVRIKEENPEIVIGSIAVTAGTVNRAKKNESDETIQIMIHGDAEENNSTLCALLWISQLPDKRIQENIGNRKKSRAWRRIPNTPHIAPLGEKSISILRYRRKLDGMLDFDKPLYGRTPEQMYNDFQRLNILKTGHWKYTNRHDLLTVNMRLAFRYSFLELGPLYSWLNNQFRYFFEKKDGRLSRAQLLVYPSHPVTDTMLDRIRQESSFSSFLPEGGMIPLKFLGQRTVSPLLASHLVAHRIEKMVKKHKWEKWSTVVFDDGTITGKHLREITQFFQGIGASDYYTIALLDRSGLPAQEEVYDRFENRHKRFWRWDVPGLGNKRNCPLCQALAIAQMYAQKLTSERQEKRLKEWLDIWKVRDVDLEWHKGCLPQTPLSPPLDITMGVCENITSGVRQEKNMKLWSSTAASSLLIELTRLTTRADVAVKKARKVASDHPDAAIEMVASQLLLFLDELSPKEKLDRFRQLLSLTWDRRHETAATSLVGLCFTLVDNDIIEDLWGYCIKEFWLKKRIGNLDAIISVNIIKSKYEFEKKGVYSLPSISNEIGMINSVMLSVGMDLKHAVCSFLVRLYRNPSNENSLSAHSTEIRKKLSKIQGKAMDDALIKRTGEEIIQDMQLTGQILRDLQSKLLLHDKVPGLENLSLSTRQLAEACNEKHELIISHVKVLEQILYGSRSVEGLVTGIGKEIFKHFQDIDDFDNRFTAILVRSIRQRWTDIISGKESNEKNVITAKRWRGSDGNVIKPIISCSASHNFQGIWLYCDSFVRGVLEDAFCNVFHASTLISDQFSNKPLGNSKKAHLWWSIEIDGNHAVVVMANATANKKIILRQNANVAGLEHAGGRIEFAFKDTSGSLNEDSIVLTKIKIPLHSYFIKEEL